MKIAFAGILIALCLAGKAQLVQVYSEACYDPVEVPAVENYPLPNQKTFRIYVEYFNENLHPRTAVEINGRPAPMAFELKCVDWFGNQ